MWSADYGDDGWRHLRADAASGLTENDAAQFLWAKPKISSAIVGADHNSQPGVSQTRIAGGIWPPAWRAGANAEQNCRPGGCGEKAGSAARVFTESR